MPESVPYTLQVGRTLAIRLGKFQFNVTVS